VLGGKFIAERGEGPGGRSSAFLKAAMLPRSPIGLRTPGRGLGFRQSTRCTGTKGAGKGPMVTGTGAKKKGKVFLEAVNQPVEGLHLSK